MESMGLAILAIDMATLGATALRSPSKTRLLRGKGSITRKLPREAAKIKVANGGGNGGKAWDYGNGLGNQWGKSGSSWNKSYGKGFGKKGLNEMGGNGCDSDDVRDLNGIHLLTAGPALGAQAHLPVPVLWNPIPYAEQIQRVAGDGRRRGDLGAQRQQMHNQCSVIRESIRGEGPRGIEWIPERYDQSYRGGTRIPNLDLWRRSLRAARRNSAKRLPEHVV